MHIVIFEACIVNGKCYESITNRNKYDTLIVDFEKFFEVEGIRCVGTGGI